MPLPVCSDQGQGPVVVLVHGVGVGPGSFAAVAAELADDHRVVVVGRPTGRGGSALPLEDQADALVAGLDELGLAEPCFVGVSGGATLGLVVGLRHPGRCARFVLHEPLVGRHVPELHERFAALAAHASEGDAEAMDVMRAVMGEQTWAALGPQGRSTALAEAGRWRSEVAEFARFAPTAADLHALAGTPLLVTVGAASPPMRHAAAGVLAELAGASVEVLADAGNVAQIDAPGALVAAIRAWRPLPTGAQP